MPSSSIIDESLKIYDDVLYYGDHTYVTQPRGEFSQYETESKQISKDASAYGPGTIGVKPGTITWMTYNDGAKSTQDKTVCYGPATPDDFKRLELTGDRSIDEPILQASVICVSVDKDRVVMEGPSKKGETSRLPPQVFKWYRDLRSRMGDTLNEEQLTAIRELSVGFGFSAHEPNRENQTEHIALYEWQPDEEMKRLAENVGTMITTQESFNKYVGQ